MDKNKKILVSICITISVASLIGLGVLFNSNKTEDVKEPDKVQNETVEVEETKNIRKASDGNGKLVI